MVLFCQWSPPLLHCCLFLFNTASVLNIGIFCIDRLILLCRPLIFRNGVTGLQALCILLFPWVCAIGLIIPYFFIAYIRYLKVFCFAAVTLTCVCLVILIFTYKIRLTSDVWSIASSYSINDDVSTERRKRVYTASSSGGSLNSTDSYRHSPMDYERSTSIRFLMPEQCGMNTEQCGMNTEQQKPLFSKNAEERTKYGDRKDSFSCHDGDNNEMNVHRYDRDNSRINIFRNFTKSGGISYESCNRSNDKCTVNILSIKNDKYSIGNIPSIKIDKYETGNILSIKNDKYDTGNSIKHDKYSTGNIPSIKNKLKRKKSRTSSVITEHMRYVATEKRVNKTFIIMLLVYLSAYLPSATMTVYVNACDDCSCKLVHILRDLIFLAILSSAVWRPLNFILRLKTLRCEVQKVLKSCNCKLLFLRKMMVRTASSR